MSGVNVGTAYLEIVPSARGFSRKLSSEVGTGMSAAGSRAGDDAAKGFASRFGSGVKAAARAGALAIGGLGALGIAGAKFGLEIAAGNEQAQISFTTMLGSAQKAGSFLKDLQAFAAKTPFEFPELQTAASSLISAGVEAKKVIPIMTTLGDVTSGMGTGAEGVQRATIALQQMNAAGKITGEDLNQLRDAGIPVYDLLAAATGRSKKAVSELAQKGKLGAKDLGLLMKALESGKGLERFSGLMDKQSQSLTGLISTFKDTLGQGLANAVQPLIPLIKDGLGAASAYLAVILPKVSAALKDMVGNAQDFFAGLTLADPASIGAPLEGFVAAGQRARVTFLQVSAAAQAAYRFVATVIDVFRGGVKDTSGLSDGVALLAIRIGRDIRVAVDAAKPGIIAVRDAFSQFFATIKGGDFSSLSGIGATLSKIWAQLQPTLAKVPPLLQNVADSMPGVNAAVEVGGKVFGFIADHIDLVVKAMPFLLAGFAAYKALQIANNAVGKDSAIGFYVQTAATIALAVSNRQLAAALNYSTGAQTVSLVARLQAIRATVSQTVATVAHAVAQRASALASSAFAAAQWLVNAALTANPIGIVIVALAALAAGLIYAYQNSETFRSYVSTAFSMIKIGALSLAKVVVTAFQMWANVWLTVVGALLDGAAKAFGWVPGIGPKLQGAATEFGKFKDSANAKLDEIKNDIDVNINTEQANLALEALHREFLDKGWTVTAEVNTRMVYGANGQLVPVPAHASGGPVGPGLHVVGDNPDGSWNRTTELLALNGNGRVYNQSQLKVAPAGGGADGELSDRTILKLANAIRALPAPVMGVDTMSRAMNRKDRS